MTKFDEAICAYDKDKSNDNREAFYQAYKSTKEVVDTLDYESKECFNPEWQSIETIMPGLRMSSNKFTKFASFGAAAMGESSTLATVKNSTSGSVSKIKRFLAAQPAAAVSEPVAQEVVDEVVTPVVEAAPARSRSAVLAS